MKVEVLQWTKDGGWSAPPALTQAGVVLYFGDRALLEGEHIFHTLRKFYPTAHLIGCSTGGEIFGAEVLTGSISVMAMSFAYTTCKPALVEVAGAEDSYAAGSQIAQQLADDALRYVMVFGDGTNVNGSELIKGLFSVLPQDIIVTGGLAGDGADFGRTLVGLNRAPQPKCIAAIGFYGDALRVGYGSGGGWKPFGPLWQITRSQSNILYELNGKPALDLYRIYLGDAALHLPKNALLYPLNLRPHLESDSDFVRTIVGVDYEKKSLIFAGDVPEGYLTRLMRSEFSQMVEGSHSAAEAACESIDSPGKSLAFLVSCIGRKLVLNHSTAHETQAIAHAFGQALPTIGFYSYGEICPLPATGECGLHNQTMTVTVLHETAPASAA